MSREYNEFLYGKLNKEVKLKEYRGKSTETATTKVDNDGNIIEVDVKKVPKSLNIKANGENHEYNGSQELSIDLDLEGSYITESELNVKVNDALTTNVYPKINSERNNREQADRELQTNIDNEKTARENADNNLQEQIDAEIENRTQADNNLQEQIDTSNQSIEDNTQAIETEKNERQTADNELSNNISSLSNNLTTETSNRLQGDLDLKTEIEIKDQQLREYVDNKSYDTLQDLPILDTEHEENLPSDSHEIITGTIKLNKIAKNGVPDAGEETKGIIQLASLDEASAGINSVKAITPYSLKQELDKITSFNILNKKAEPLIETYIRENVEEFSDVWLSLTENGNALDPNSEAYKNAYFTILNDAEYINKYFRWMRNSFWQESEWYLKYKEVEIWADGQIFATEENVQEVANNYIKDNYDRDPQHLDALIITITDLNTTYENDNTPFVENDKILYIYSTISNMWINSGINGVDLTNYIQKSDVIDNLTSTDTNKPLSANQGKVLNEKIESEISTRESKDNELQDEITENNNAISTEITDRTNADTTLQNNINTEKSERESADNTLQTNINKKLDRVDTVTPKSQVYGKGGNGSQYMFNYDDTPSPNSLVFRDGTGKSKIATPSDNDNGKFIVNKEYVDNKLTEKSYNTLRDLPKLKTNNITSLTVENEEEIKNTINLHKISKTGTSTDLTDSNDLVRQNEFIAEKEARENKDTELQDSIDTNSTNIATNTSSITSLQENKLDKVTLNNDQMEAYIKKSDGSQGMRRISESAINYSLIIRNEVGKAQVTTPTEEDDGNFVTNKEYVDGKITNEQTARENADTTLQTNIDTKLDKQGPAETNYDRVYAVKPNGEQETIFATNFETANSICRRDSAGNIGVTSPHFGTSATNKTYVDNKVTTEKTERENADTNLQTNIDTKLDKTIYEFNKTISFDATGILHIGRFRVYDSNLTIKINGTTDKTFNGTLVIATQNGMVLSANVYGDADNQVTPRLYYKRTAVEGSANRGDVDIYFNGNGWLKTIVHFQCVGIPSEPTDIMQNLTALPEETLTVNNVLNIKANKEYVDTKIIDEQTARESADNTLQTNINTKLDRVETTGIYQVYAKETNGSQVMTPASINPVGNTIMKRDGDGKSRIVTPSDTDPNNTIVNKEYVDNKKYESLKDLPKLKTDNQESLLTSAEEEINGVINLHKISKTGKFTDLNDITQSSQAQAGIIQLATTDDIQLGTDETKAVTPKQLKDKISEIKNLNILNKGIIESTESTIQDTCTNYIQTEYGREPKSLDALIVTLTDRNNDKVLYIYSESSTTWINSGFNTVDLTNYLQKSDVIDNLTSEETEKPLSAKQGNILDDKITDEKTARESADNELNTLITNITNNTTLIQNEQGGFSAGSGANAGSQGGAIGRSAGTGSGFAGGANCSSANGGTIGYLSKTRHGGSAGREANSYDGGAIGSNAKARDGFSGGLNAQVKNTAAEGNTPVYIDAIQLGTGTNETPKTLQIYGDNIWNAETHQPNGPLLEKFNEKATQTDLEALGERVTTNESNISNKLDKVETDDSLVKAYVKQSDGTQGMRIISSGASPSALVMRDVDGKIRATTPSDTDEGTFVTTKRYVDERLSTKVDQSAFNTLQTTVDTHDTSITSLENNTLKIDDFLILDSGNSGTNMEQGDNSSSGDNMATEIVRGSDIMNSISNQGNPLNENDYNSENISNTIDTLNNLSEPAIN